MRTVTLAGGQGFYGDATDRTQDLAEACDYLVLEGLAELTLAILQKDRMRDPSLGYARDLLAHAKAFLPAVAAGRTRVITNAGGLNPIGAAKALSELAEAGGHHVKIFTVLGDDVAPLLGDTKHDGLRFANVYLGASPIVEALEQGAQIVIAGRVADSALFLAPLVFEHGWSWDDWNKLAAGTAVGHLMECSGQATGGNLSWRWWDSPRPWALPLPLADVNEDGSAILRKIAGSGGMVTFETVREQLMYEIHDPAAYLAPDVSADFTTVQLDDLGGDRVRVSGATGRPAPEMYKALVCSSGGWMGEVSIGLGWPDAPAKAEAMFVILQHRAAEAGLEVLEWCKEIWGHDALLPGRPTGTEPSEVVLRVAWRCAERAQAARVGRLVPPLYTSGPVPGMTTATHGFNFEPSELLKVDARLIDRSLVQDKVRVSAFEAVASR